MLKPPNVQGANGLARWESALFLLMALAAAATIWIPERPPMVDVPQHAAQVVAWRALLEGHYPWADLVQLNYVTPYLLAYCLLLPLTYVVSIIPAIKILLSVAMLSFVGLCRVLRRELNGDKGLDWLFLLGFFGFAWRWGFLTFLCAAPLVILFIIVALRQTREDSLKNQLLVLLVGGLLLISHGLQFLFAVGIGGILILIDGRSIRDKLKAYLPYYILGVLAIAFRWALNTENAPETAYIFGAPLYIRPFKMLFLVTGDAKEELYGAIAALVAFAAPLLTGRRIGPARSFAPFAVCAAILLFAPDIAMSTAYFYQRFGLFLLPFWALAFKANDAGESPRETFERLAALAIPVAAALALHVQRQATIAVNNKGFETVLAAAEPNRRALSVIYDPTEGDSLIPVYLHWPAWYAVEKNGFVDFNFGYFIIVIVKLRKDRIPPVSKYFGDLPPPSALAQALPDYDYVFVRGTPEDLDGLLKNSGRCQFKPRAQDGPWTLLEKQSCAPG